MSKPAASKSSNKKAELSNSSSSDWGSDSEESVEEGSPSEFRAQYDEEDLPKEQCCQEAPVELSKVRFFFEKTFRPCDLFDSKGGLKNEGKLVLSVSNGELTLDTHNAEDFPLESPLDTSTLTPLDAARRKHGHHHGRKGGHRKGHRGGLHRDIVKGITLSKFTTNWEKAFGVELSTVRAIGNEGYHNRNKMVTRLFATREVSATEARDYEILNRKITKGTIVFQNKYPGATVENFDAAYTRAGPNMLIPFRNPFVMYHNAMETTKIKGPTANLEGFIQVPLEVAKKYTEITRKEMSSGLSFGDISNDFTVTFFLPMPEKRLAGHQEYLATGKGRRFDSFADKYNALPLSKLNAKNEQNVPYSTLFEQTEFTFSGFFDGLYIKCNGRKIPFNTKQ
jgi:hypothetical protein